MLSNSLLYLSLSSQTLSRIGWSSLPINPSSQTSFENGVEFTSTQSLFSNLLSNPNPFSLSKSLPKSHSQRYTTGQGIREVNLWFWMNLILPKVNSHRQWGWRGLNTRIPKNQPLLTDSNTRYFRSKRSELHVRSNCSVQKKDRNFRSAFQCRIEYLDRNFRSPLTD